MPLISIFLVLAVIGSLEHPLLSLYIEGSVTADGESFNGVFLGKNGSTDNMHIGPGGGSGGTILLFLRNLDLGESGNLSSVGGHGSLSGGGGGGGGRIHFHWSDIPTGDVYWPIATLNGTIYTGLVILLFPASRCSCMKSPAILCENALDLVPCNSLIH